MSGERFIRIGDALVVGKPKECVHGKPIGDDCGLCDLGLSPTQVSPSLPVREDTSECAHEWSDYGVARECDKCGKVDSASDDDAPVREEREPDAESVDVPLVLFEFMERVSAIAHGNPKLTAAEVGEWWLRLSRATTPDRDSLREAFDAGVHRGIHYDEAIGDDAAFTRYLESRGETTT